jgi:hypothetical protein
MSHRGSLPALPGDADGEGAPEQWVRIKVRGSKFTVHGLVVGTADDGSGNVYQVHGVKRFVQEHLIEGPLADQPGNFVQLHRAAAWAH